MIALREGYGGHAKQALITGRRVSADMKTYYVTVDEDIDPTNLNEVLWAMCTRVDPATSIDIIRDAWTADLDPRVSPARREAGDLTVASLTGMTSHTVCYDTPDHAERFFAAFSKRSCHLVSTSFRSSALNTLLFGN